MRARQPAERAAKRKGPRKHKHDAALVVCVCETLYVRSRPAAPAAVARVAAYSADSRLRSTMSFSSFGEARRSASGAKAAAFNP
jgi:hypothetical protein